MRRRAALAPESVTEDQTLSRARFGAGATYRITSSTNAITSGSAVSRFTQLVDAPRTYATYAGRVVVVNGAESGLEFGRAVTNTVSATFEVPWQSGDTVPTLRAGSASTSNGMDAIQAQTWSGTAVSASAGDGYAVKAIATSGIGLSVTTTTGNGATITTGGGSNVALWITQGASSQPGVIVQSSGSSYGLSVVTTSGSSSASGIFGQSAGPGPSIEGYKDTTGYHAVQGRINAASSTKAGIYGWSNGASGGAGVYGYQTGSGYAVRAEVANSSSTAEALYVSTNGTSSSIATRIENTGAGRGLTVAITSSGNSRNVVEATTIGSGIVYYGSSSGAGTVVYAVTTGTGSAAELINSNDSGTQVCVSVQQQGSGAALNVQTIGTGKAAAFALANASATGTAVSISNTGSGHGLDITSVGIGISIAVSGGLAALSAYTSGTGAALFCGGQFQHSPTAVTGTTSLTVRDSFVAITSISSAFTITLPSASSCTDRRIRFKDETGSANGTTKKVTISRAGSDTIEGATTTAISTPYGGLSLYSNGSMWLVLP